MSIKGALSDVSLADISQLLGMGGKTGCLTLTHKSNNGDVYFEGRERDLRLRQEPTGPYRRASHRPRSHHPGSTHGGDCPQGAEPGNEIG